MSSKRKKQGPSQRVDPRHLAVEESEAGFVLALNGRPLTTPRGAILRHRSSRLLEHIGRELSISRRLDPRVLGAYSLYSTQIDFIEAGEDVILSNLDHVAIHDPLLHRSAGPEGADQMGYWYFVMEFLARNQCHLPVIYHDVNEAGDLVPMPAGDEAGKANFTAFEDLLRASYMSLSPERRAVVITLMSVHEAGLLLPLMLVLGRCSGEEYGEALLAAHAAHPRTFEPRWGEYGRNLQALRADAYIALEYVAHCYEENENEIDRLIRSGESMRMEFKSTLRQNLHTGQKDPAVEHAALKTIAAFLNSDGGTLLIGVTDRGEVVGIESDQFESHDKLQLHLSQLLNDRLGLEASSKAPFALVRIGEHHVVRVDVRKAGKPVILKSRSGDEEFFVRTGPRTVKLSVSEAIEYSKDRFGE